jgi:hypothetical protein
MLQVLCGTIHNGSNNYLAFVRLPRCDILDGSSFPGTGGERGWNTFGTEHR